MATQADAIGAPTIIPASVAQTAPGGDVDNAGGSNGPVGSSTASAILTAWDKAPSPAPADDLALAQPAGTMSATDLAAAMTSVDALGAAGLVSVPIVQALMASTGDGVNELTAATDQVDVVSAGVEGITPDAVAAVAATVATVSTAATDVVAATATVVSDAAAAVADTMTELIDTVSAAASETTAGIAAVASGPLMTVAPAASAAVDDALDLLGPDPAGGVATLVSLVTAADMFELSDVAPDGAVVAADDLLDSLVGDTPLPDALLGDAANDGDAPLIPPLDPGPVDLLFG